MISKIGFQFYDFQYKILPIFLQDHPEIETIIARVEWTTLIFFATLFVIMEALSRLTFLKWIGDEVIGVIAMVNEDYRYVFPSN